MLHSHTNNKTQSKYNKQTTHNDYYTHKPTVITKTPLFIELSTARGVYY